MSSLNCVRSLVSCLFRRLPIYAIYRSFTVFPSKFLRIYHNYLSILMQLSIFSSLLLSPQTLLTLLKDMYAFFLIIDPWAHNEFCLLNNRMGIPFSCLTFGRIFLLLTLCLLMPNFISLSLFISLSFFLSLSLSLSLGWFRLG